MKKKVLKTIIIFVPILAISSYYLAPWIKIVSTGYKNKLIDWLDERKGISSEKQLEEQQKKRREYLENLEQPKLTGKEVAKILEEEKSIKTQEMYDIVDWYVYHVDRDVIKQVLHNRLFEMRIILPEERGGTSVFTDYTISDGYNGPFWGTDTEKLIHHQEMHVYAKNKDSDPHFIYYLITSSGSFNNVYYNQLLFHDDILAYLRIYSTYSDWPSIKDICKCKIEDYSCVWFDWDTINEVLKMAEEKGPEQAHEVYMQRYQNNYQKYRGSFRDQKNPEKTYEYESVFQGWSSENLKGKTYIYNIKADEAVIGIKNVEKIILVSRDGEDITHLCSLSPENIMIVPLKKAKITKLEYEISVTPPWWDRYISHRVNQKISVSIEEIPLY